MFLIPPSFSMTSPDLHHSPVFLFLAEFHPCLQIPWDAVSSSPFLHPHLPILLLCFCSQEAHGQAFVVYQAFVVLVSPVFVLWSAGHLFAHESVLLG